jgi:hypothetical protein
MDGMAATLIGEPSAVPERLGPGEDADWNEAYVTVESYLLALGLRNRLLLGRLILRILDRAAARRETDPGAAGTKIVSLAMEETIALVAAWFCRVAGVELPESRLAARGRLALLLADLPGRHQAWFLAEGPLPAEVTDALREAYLRAQPETQRRAMVPRPIRLSPIMRRATEWWEGMNRSPVTKALIVAGALLAAGIGLLLTFWR